MYKPVGAVVSTRWLSERLFHPNVTILDGSWHFPSSNRNQASEYKAGHIPGALPFNIDDCSDKKSKFQHMLPSPQLFASYVSKLGIGNHSQVIVYDNHDVPGLFSAPRVWWMFRVFGHASVAVLDGGLPKWKKERRELTDEVPEAYPQVFVPAFRRSELVKSYEEMLANVEHKTFDVVDARSEDWFYGRAADHVKDIPPGRIPGSVNVPYRSLLDPVQRTLLPVPELKEKLRQAGVTGDGAVTSSCGSGVTACMVALAAYHCGLGDVAVYDGSWQEWWNRAPHQHLIDCPQKQQPRE